jgi:hypothetical protein
MIAILPKSSDEKSFKNTEADLSVGFASYPPRGRGISLLLYQPQEVRQPTLAERFLKGQDVARVNVYIDGFNLYYGALKQTPYKSLDLLRLPNPPPVGHDPRNQVLHCPSECAAQYADFGSSL